MSLNWNASAGIFCCNEGDLEPKRLEPKWLRIYIGGWGEVQPGNLVERAVSKPLSGWSLALF